jgi:hypothetical protein
MTGPHDEQAPLGPEDAAFVERLTEEFAPGTLGSARRTAFDAALEERITHQRPRWLAVPVLAGATLAALGAWLLLPARFEPPAPSSPGSSAVVAETRTAAEWEDELLDAMAFGEIEESDSIDELPDDYAAIAAVFLDS